MTSRDVRDILSLPARGEGSTPTPAPKKVRKPKAPRGDGITRELYALMGDNVPPLALAALRKPGLKERLKDTGKQKAAKWRITEFKNEARGDGLKLKHWARETEEPESAQPYKFAKYSTTSNPISYSTEEYLHHLRDDDWTREETDYLFSLLQMYDLRFTVVADRYDFPSGKERTVEHLKARYYSICQKLIAARPSTGTEEERAKEVSSYNFDPVREAERKAHVASLIWRSPAQIAEEDFLYIESRRLEQSAQRFSQERDALMSTIDGMLYQLVKSQADLSGGGAGPGSSSSAAAAAKKGRRSDTMLFDGAELVAPPGGGQKVSKAMLAQDTINCVYRFDGPAPANQPPVTLRSTRVAAPKATLAQRITNALAELGMPTSGKQLVMPTRANVARYEELLNATSTLVELKRQVERNELEIEVQKRKKAALGGTVASAPSAEAEASRGSVEPPRTARSMSAMKRSPSASSVASSARERKRARKG